MPGSVELVEQQEPPRGLGHEPLRLRVNRLQHRTTVSAAEDAEWPEAHMASGGRVQAPPK